MKSVSLMSSPLGAGSLCRAEEAESTSARVVAMGATSDVEAASSSSAAASSMASPRRPHPQDMTGEGWNREERLVMTSHYII